MRNKIELIPGLITVLAMLGCNFPVQAPPEPEPLIEESAEIPGLESPLPPIQVIYPTPLHIPTIVPILPTATVSMPVISTPTFESRSQIEINEELIRKAEASIKATDQAQNLSLEYLDSIFPADYVRAVGKLTTILEGLLMNSGTATIIGQDEDGVYYGVTAEHLFWNPSRNAQADKFVLSQPLLEKEVEVTDFSYYKAPDSEVTVVAFRTDEVLTAYPNFQYNWQPEYGENITALGFPRAAELNNIFTSTGSWDPYAADQWLETQPGGIFITALSGPVSSGQAYLDENWNIVAITKAIYPKLYSGPDPTGTVVFSLPNLEAMKAIARSGLP